MKTNVDALVYLKALIETHGSQTAAAQRLKVSVPYVNDLLHGRRKFSKVMLAKLGLRRREIVEAK